jgi:hypothetical protein
MIIDRNTALLPEVDPIGKGTLASKSDTHPGKHHTYASKSIATEVPRRFFQDALIRL